eukprot:scaffold245402_cov46-Attheya_sp.AAC.3
MCITTTDADPNPNPAEDSHGNDPLSTSNSNPPNHAMSAPPQVSSTGVTPKPKRLQDFLKKTIFYYSQNIQGSGKCKEIDSSPYKLEYITTMMKEKGIDFHHGTDKASDSNKEGDEENPLLQTRKGHTRGGVAIILSPKATEAWKRADLLHYPFISSITWEKKLKSTRAAYTTPLASANRKDQNF